MGNLEDFCGEMVEKDTTLQETNSRSSDYVTGALVGMAATLIGMAGGFLFYSAYHHIDTRDLFYTHLWTTGICSGGAAGYSIIKTILSSMTLR